MSNGKSALSVLKPAKYFDSLSGIIKQESKKYKSAIFVTTNKPYGFLSNALKAHNIKPRQIFFIGYNKRLYILGFWAMKKNFENYDIIEKKAEEKVKQFAKVGSKK